MTEIKQAMPLLARNEGLWDSHYRYTDAEGAKIDEHHSRWSADFLTAARTRTTRPTITRRRTAAPRCVTSRPIIATGACGSTTS